MTLLPQLLRRRRRACTTRQPIRSSCPNKASLPRGDGLRLPPSSDGHADAPSNRTTDDKRPTPLCVARRRFGRWAVGALAVDGAASVPYVPHPQLGPVRHGRERPPRWSTCTATRMRHRPVTPAAEGASEPWCPRAGPAPHRSSALDRCLRAGVDGPGCDSDCDGRPCL